MTLIECYNASVVENIIVCLRLRPEKLILLGTDEEITPAKTRYAQFLEERKYCTDVETCSIDGQNMMQLADTLKGVVMKQRECVIDLTCCTQVVAMAVGAMLMQLSQEQRKNVCVQTYNMETDEIVDCDNDGVVCFGMPGELSVREMIALHGGIVHPGSYQPPRENHPDDVSCLWEMASKEPKIWNRTLAALSEFESRADSKMQVFLALPYIWDEITDFEEKRVLIENLLEQMHASGLVVNYSHGDFLEYTYRQPLTRYCTRRAGDILEIKTFLEARNMREDGKLFFNDCMMGVNIDWDGIVYDLGKKKPETRNEIDVILMHGAIPLFVSCKNGDIGDDELYKLHTVATRFGGPHARKMLIAANLDKEHNVGDQFLIQRARDMNIRLVTDIADMTREQWQEEFRKAIE